MASDFEWFHPRNDHVQDALSADHLWNQTGSGLYNCVRILDEQTDPRHFKTSFIGDVDGADTSEDALLLGMRTRVADMLTGMAIEAWLKGLIVAALKREGLEELNERVRQLTDQRLLDMGLSSEVTMAQIFEAMKSPEIEALFGDISSETKQQTMDRAALLQDHHRHNLADMATAVGFDPPLAEKVIWTLRYYSQMIELGRYPAPKKSRPLVQVRNLEALREGRAELFQRILAKHDSLSNGSA